MMKLEREGMRPLTWSPEGEAGIVGERGTRNTSKKAEAGRPGNPKERQPRAADSSSARGRGLAGSCGRTQVGSRKSLWQQRRESTEQGTLAEKKGSLSWERVQGERRGHRDTRELPSMARGTQGVGGGEGEVRGSH